MNETITILIAEDHRLIRDSWTLLLETDPRFIVIGSTGNGKAAIRLAGEHKPNVVLMDINMEPVNGLEATSEIRKCSPGTKVIGLSMHSDPGYARKMIHNGAAGYVTKNSPHSELLLAIDEVFKGNIYICQEVKDLLADQELTLNPAKNHLVDLTRKENLVIEYVKKGFSSKEISNELKISFKTVEVHRYNILRKLGVKNTVALVNMVNASGW